MNEVLTQIAKKAMVEHCISHVRLREFAELLIKECLSVIEEMNPHDPERDIDDIFDEVEQHFGVE